MQDEEKYLQKSFSSVNTTLKRELGYLAHPPAQDETEFRIVQKRSIEGL